MKHKNKRSCSTPDTTILGCDKSHSHLGITISLFHTSINKKNKKSFFDLKKE